MKVKKMEKKNSRKSIKEINITTNLICGGGFVISFIRFRAVPTNGNCRFQVTKFQQRHISNEMELKEKRWWFV